jgi:hypothetical protein
MEPQQPRLKSEALFLLSGCFSTLAGRLGSPQVVLPWIYSAIGGPLLLVGFLVPSVRVGGLVAQLTVVPSLMARAYRKWAYVLAAFASALGLVIIGGALLEVGKVVALTIFFAALLLLGSASGVAALASQEVMGKTIARDAIGRLLTLQVSSAGALTLLFMGGLILFAPGLKSDDHNTLMMMMAAGSWVVAGLVFACIREPASPVGKKSTVRSDTREGLRLLKTVPWFRNYVLVRALFLSVGLATPFYSVHAAREFSHAAMPMSLIVLASGVTSIFSAPVWSKSLTLNPSRALIWSGVLAALAGTVVIVHELLGEPHPIVYMLVFALLELAVQGMTQGSKTYLMLMSPQAERPKYLAVSNAVLGVLSIFASGLIGVLAYTTHIYTALGVLILLALLASLSVRRLKAPDMR